MLVSGGGAAAVPTIVYILLLLAPAAWAAPKPAGLPAPALP